MPTEARLARICRDWLQQRELVGLSAAIVEHDGLVWAKGFGSAQLELGVPVGQGSVFEIASLTKLLTAELVLQLVAAGQLGLEQTLGETLACVDTSLPPAWYPIRIEQILRHSSGIRNYTAVPAYWQHTREDLPYSHILDLVRLMPLDFEPGSRYAYDNTGFFLLGLLLEAITGARYDELLRTRIFTPLGMKASRAQDYGALAPGRAAGYSRVEGHIRNKPYYSATGTFSAGCVLASASDLALWAANLYSGHLPPELRAAQFTPRLSLAANEVAEGFSLGLGWFRLDNGGKPFWGHNGGILGFASSLVHLPERRRTAIVLANCDWLENPHELSLALLDALDSG